MPTIIARSKFVVATLVALGVWAPAELLATAQRAKFDCLISCTGGACSCTGKCKCHCDIAGRPVCENYK